MYSLVVARSREIHAHIFHGHPRAEVYETRNDTTSLTEAHISEYVLQSAFVATIDVYLIFIIVTRHNRIVLIDILFGSAMRCINLHKCASAARVATREDISTISCTNLLSIPCYTDDRIMCTLSSLQIFNHRAAE